MMNNVLEDPRYPRGFRACGLSCGIKSSGQPDLALIYSEVDCHAAGMFTTNRFAAAPVIISCEHLNSALPRAIVINSGNANACTGQKGIEAAKRMTELVADLLHLDPEQVLVCSTGIIGVELDMVKVEKGIRAATRELNYSGWPEAARAIMTTDTKTKLISRSIDIGQTNITITGIAKGAGMIHPRLATMLAIIATDANISIKALQSAFAEAVQSSFNSISVDGDTSTNDAALILCNGLANNPVLVTFEKDYEKFKQALIEVCTYLAREIARDGEGASKLIEINVYGARSPGEARQVAMAVADSNLVKTAIFGGDPNWGRIICAIGYSGIEVELEKVSLKINDVLLFVNAVGQPTRKEELNSLLKGNEVKIDINLGQGQSHWRAWTCDLTYDYVRMNAEYKT